MDNVSDIELQALYRALAQRCHPDQAATPVERDRLASLMERVNQAYADRDVPALRRLARKVEGAAAQSNERDQPSSPPPALTRRSGCSWRASIPAAAWIAIVIGGVLQGVGSNLDRVAQTGAIWSGAAVVAGLVAAGWLARRLGKGLLLFLPIAWLLMAVISVGGTLVSAPLITALVRQSPSDQAGADPSANTVVVTIKNNALQPRDVVVPLGATVTWVNYDGGPQFIAGTGWRYAVSADPGRLNPIGPTTIEPAPDNRYSVPFTEAGTYRYNIDLQGKVILGEIQVTP